MRGWGLPEPGELDRVVIVSPHLDDAVLGCGNFMASHPGAYVVTVFAGNPPAYPTDPMRKWDVQSGFSPGDDVMEARRHEDDAALAVLDATPVHLEFIEHRTGDVQPGCLRDGMLPNAREQLGAGGYWNRAGKDCRIATHMGGALNIVLAAQRIDTAAALTDIAG